MHIGRDTGLPSSRLMAAGDSTSVGIVQNLRAMRQFGVGSEIGPSNGDREAHPEAGTGNDEIEAVLSSRGHPWTFMRKARSKEAGIGLLLIEHSCLPKLPAFLIPYHDSLAEINVEIFVQKTHDEDGDEEFVTRIETRRKFSK